MTAPRAAVILASAGRPALLASVMADVDAQSAPLAHKIVAVPDQASLPPQTEGWTVVVGTRGLAAQRNAGIAALASDAEVVFFFDDDAVVRSDYVEQGLAAFARDPSLVGITGTVLLDGAAHSAGEISPAGATAAIAESWQRPLTASATSRQTLYGCNFAYHRGRVPDITFDARLPLYSWLEDHDFARRLLRHGGLATVPDCVIVHRGASSGGRTNHVRLGYSQVMNPVHLHRTGSFPLWLSAWEIFRPTAKNVAYGLTGAQAPWRRERIRGNLLGVADAARGRITPERITDL